MEGVLNIDKPSGMTSHDVVARIRRLSKIRRVGHAGTLDPMATGVLLVCVGRATRLVEYLVGQPKTYVAVIRLGQATDTYDKEGTIVSERPVPTTLALSDLDRALDSFRGEIEQLPPMYSAIKKNGQPLYKLARQGIEIERQPRVVTIYDAQITSWRSPDLSLQIRCSAGTYIRSIAHDLGGALNCGGHLISLRRTQIGSFTTDAAVPLSQLTATSVSDHIRPPYDAVAHLYRFEITSEQAQDLVHGKILAAADPTPVGTLAATFTSDGRFWGIVERHQYSWRPKKIIQPLET